MPKCRTLLAPGIVLVIAVGLTFFLWPNSQPVATPNLNASIGVTSQPALPNNEEVTDAATQSVKQSERAWGSRPDFAQYVGTWQKHGSEIIIQPDRTGTRRHSIDSCAPDSESSDLCTQIDQLKFVDSIKGIRGIVVSVALVNTFKKVTAPATFSPKFDTAKVGDTFELRLLPDSPEPALCADCPDDFKLDPDDGSYLVTYNHPMSPPG